MARGADRGTGLRWRLAEEDDDRDQAALFAGDELTERHVGTGEFRGMEFLHVNAATIINQVPATSRMPFRHTVNVYRGCSHACTYCFARPTHEYLGLGIGEDFDRRIVVKVNAVERLRAELAARRWGGHTVAMGTNTDPYQRCEGKYHLTRGVVATLVAASNPFSLLTKSTLILRDADLLAEGARRAAVRADLSIGTLDEDVWRLTEPGTPHPRQRVEAVRRLNERGVPTGVLIAPVLPGLSDDPAQVAAVVDACVDAGAVSVSTVGLHLRPGVRAHFPGWLASARPDLVEAYEARYAHRSYLPDADQRLLADAVRARVAARRARVGGPTASRPRPPLLERSAPRSASEGGDQLRLGL